MVRFWFEISPGQILVVEGVDGVLSDCSDPNQGAVQAGHRCIHLLHVLVIPMLFCPVVHLQQQHMVKKVLGHWAQASLIKVAGVVISLS